MFCAANSEIKTSSEAKATRKSAEETTSGRPPEILFCALHLKMKESIFKKRSVCGYIICLYMC